jgi:cellulose synthase/poly-beta-1,6-N-acetylglucosamine synthase-like glycosyltransferase
MAQFRKPKSLSVVVPVRNEEDNVADLISEIRKSLKNKINYEIIYVDDGSTDHTHKNLIATTLIKASKAPTTKIVLYPSRCMVIIKNLAANVMNQRLYRMNICNGPIKLFQTAIKSASY